MNKSEAWDEMKEWLERAVPDVFQSALEVMPDETEYNRLKNKASGMELILDRFNSYERYFITD